MHFTVFSVFTTIYMLQVKGYTPMTLLEMLVFAAFTRQSRPSSSTPTVKFSLM